jgi:hypothetical protein
MTRSRDAGEDLIGRFGPDKGSGCRGGHREVLADCGFARWSRRPPQVFVMEPTDAWHLHHPAVARPLYTPRLRSVFSQG